MSAASTPSIIIPVIPAASTTSLSTTTVTITFTRGVVIAVTIAPPVAWAWATASPMVPPGGGTPIDLPPKIPANLLHMHEIAVPTTIAAVLLKLPTGCFTKVSHRRILNNDRAARVEAALKSIVCCGCLFFLPELDIDIAYHVVSKVIADIQVLKFTKLAQFLIDVLIEILKVFLHLLRINRLTLSINSRGYHIRALIHVSKNKSW
jgi:hypothetical protein